VGDGQQRGDLLEIGDAERRIARLPRAQQFAPAAQAQVFLGQQEPVLRLAHQRQPLAPDFADHVAAQQQARRFLAPAPDPPAQLVQLGKAKAFGLLDHHQRRIGHVDADLDHRGRHQQPCLAAGKAFHRRVLGLGPHLAMDHDHAIAKAFREHGMARLGGGQILVLGLAHHRADPIGLMARGHVAPDPLDHVGQSLLRNDAGIDGLTTGGISSSRETSISPYWASVSVRGMGVAVIARQCGVRRAFA
jgi:hypothetical protein